MGVLIANTRKVVLLTEILRVDYSDDFIYFCK